MSAPAKTGAAETPPPEVAGLVEHSARDIAYVDGLSAHMDEGGQCSAKNISDLIAMVRWNAKQFQDAADLITAQARQLAELLEALEELMVLMDDVVAGDYTPDSFTTQPARAAIAKATGAA